MPIVSKGVLYRFGDGKVVTFNTIRLCLFSDYGYLSSISIISFSFHFRKHSYQS